MVIYKCCVCDKIFDRKSNYKTHINNKKYPCIQNNKNNILFTEDLFKKICDNDKPKNNDKPSIDHKSITCNFCGVDFSKKSNLIRHYKNFCIVKQSNGEIEQMKFFCNKILEELKECKNEIVALKEKKSNNTQPQNINTMDHSQNVDSNDVICDNNNTTKSNNNNNITIVQFGKEDITKMNVPKIMDVFLKSTGGNIIANMLKQINCNPEYPEFNSIYISDLAREKVKIYDGQKFVSKKFKFIKDFIVNNVNGNINKICTNFLENNAYKKNEDILKKMHINQVSLKLITGSDAEDIVRDEIREKENKEQDTLHQNNIIDKIAKTELLNNYKDNIERDFTIDESKRVTHLENKRDGLIQITYERLKDELYNGKFIRL